MRFGWLLSAGVHAGAAALTLIAWPLASSVATGDAGQVVPIDVVDISEYSNVRAMAPQHEEESAPEEASLEEPAPPEQAEAAPAREAPRNALDFASLQRELLRDKSKNRDPRPPRGEGPPGSQVRPRAGAGTGNVAALEDRIRAVTRAHIDRRQCWRAPVDQPDYERLVVRVRLRLDARGGLIGQPEVVSPRSTAGDPIYRAAVDSARRAVLACSPFPFADDPALAAHYELWQDMEYYFDPGELR